MADDASPWRRAPHPLWVKASKARIVAVRAPEIEPRRCISDARVVGVALLFYSVAKYGSADGTGRYVSNSTTAACGIDPQHCSPGCRRERVSHVADAEAVVKFLALDTRAQGQLADLWRNIPTRFAALGPSEGRDQDRLQPQSCVTSRVLSDRARPIPSPPPRSPRTSGIGRSSPRRSGRHTPARVVPRASEATLTSPNR